MTTDPRPEEHNTSGPDRPARDTRPAQGRASGAPGPSASRRGVLLGAGVLGGGLLGTALGYGAGHASAPTAPGASAAPGAGARAGTGEELLIEGEAMPKPGNHRADRIMLTLVARF